MLIAVIEPMQWWEQVLYGLGALIIGPLAVLVVIAVASELTRAIWVRLPRQRRKPWLALLAGVICVWYLYEAWSDDETHNDRELEITAGGHVWHAIIEYGFAGWLTIEQRNTDVLLENPPISETRSISAAGLAFQIALTLELIYFGFRGWKWNVNRFSLRDPNRCPECGYDLRGNLDAGCPECGWGRGDEEMKR